MELKHLTDDVILEMLIAAVKNETNAELVVLHILAEVERRHMYSKNQPSLFAFCTEVLKLSSGATQRKIDALKAMKLIPEVEEKIRDGSLNTTNLSMAQSFLRKEAKAGKKYSKEETKQLFAKIENTTTKECQQKLADISPDSLMHEKRRPLGNGKTEIKAIVDQETLDMLDQLKGLMSHKNPTMTDGELLKELARIALQKLDPANQKSNKVKKPATTTIPAATKRAVWKRDKGQCTHPGCNSRHFVQFDHIVPVSFGGMNEPENLRLRCHAHNQRAAIDLMGLEKITQHFHQWQ